MNNATSVSVEIGGKTITIEAGLLAQQAAGSAVVTMGDTILFSGVTCTKEPREGIDYFPLQVEYREKFYAAGRFPGGFFKREARPSEKEILTARLTDRPIRPLFPSYYRNDVQINNMLLSCDCSNDSDVLSMVAGSAALTLSDIPFQGPIAGVRVGRVDGKFVVNPTNEEREGSDIDLIYAGTRELPSMIEGGGNEISEADLVAAMKIAHEACVKLIDAQLELREKMGLPVKQVEEGEKDTTLIDKMRAHSGEALSDALLIGGKMERHGKMDAVKEAMKEAMLADDPEMSKEAFRSAFDDLEIQTVRSNVLEKGKRIDGRDFRVLRQLDAEVGLLPRTHGSSLFSRGETQALVNVTLGTKSDIQHMDAVTGGESEKKFMLHYNFPPYSTGECGRLGSTSRREIGHGNLAERCLAPVIPEDYPYTVRVVSDIMGSNGSSSMASVCGGCLAMMDAGIPIKRPVAGISVGLFSNEEKAELIVDILGTEDHCGDMDFKVAGTSEGITGFQVDLKIRGLTWELVEGALEQARITRLEILEYMKSVMDKPREEMSEFAPRIEQIKIDQDKIGELIGPGGKNIRRITEMSGAQVDIDDEGLVSLFAVDKESMDIARREVEAISAEVEEGHLYHGKVTGIKEFGAFVQVLPGKDGLVHISELADCRVNNVEDVCKMGDMMWVKCIGIDDRGRVKLSRKAAMEEMDA